MNTNYRGPRRDNRALRDVSSLAEYQAMTDAEREAVTVRFTAGALRDALNSGLVKPSDPVTIEDWDGRIYLTGITISRYTPSWPESDDDDEDPFNGITLEFS
jgi:hypothetical protein